MYFARLMGPQINQSLRRTRWFVEQFYPHLAFLALQWMVSHPRQDANLVFHTFLP